MGYLLIAGYWGQEEKKGGGGEDCELTKVLPFQTPHLPNTVRSLQHERLGPLNHCLPRQQPIFAPDAALPLSGLAFCAVMRLGMCKKFVFVLERWC